MTKKFRELVSEIAPVSPADQDFWKIHKIKVIPDRNGNGDSVFKGTIQKDHTRIADKGEVAPQGDQGSTPNHDPSSLPLTTKESVEGVLGAYGFYLDELSKDTLRSYAKKSSDDQNKISKRYWERDLTGGRDEKKDKDDQRKYRQRGKGQDRAWSKITKEDLDDMSPEDFDSLIEDFDQLDELSKDTLKSYILKAYSDNQKKEREHLDKHNWDFKKLKAARERGEGSKLDRRADMISNATNKFYAKRNKERNGE